MVVGLTGGILSGKSTVASFFRELGAKVIDADRIVHEIYRTNRRVKAIVRKKIGENVFKNGHLNKRKLARLVFNDKKKLRRLEGIVHPVVIKKIKKKIRTTKRGILVLDAPLLLEAGLLKAVDYVVVAKAPVVRRLSRARKKGLSSKEVRKIMSLQMPEAKRERIADFIIDTSGSRQNTKRKVKKIWQKLNRR